MASVTMGVDPDDAVLQELTGAASLELELGRGDFIRLWNDYNFKVKTYQESMVNSTSNVVPSDTRADAVCFLPPLLWSYRTLPPL